MFEKYRKFETTFAGRPLVVETGKTCELSNGSCWVRYGETVVMANVTASAKPREGVDFFPLSVDYEERMYAVGRIPGSFTKREGKPSEKAILTSRMVDRPIRPLFPKDMRNDVSVVMTVLAVDPDCSPEITGMLATSIAISISDIPWNGPIAGISVGLVDGEIVLNPTLEQRAHNDLRLTVAGTMEKIVMIEAGANEIPEQQMLDAILAGHAEIKKMVAFINDIKSEIGKPKFEFQSMELDHDLFAAIEAMVGEQVKVALDTNDKNERDARMQPIIDAVHEKYDPEYPEQGAMLDECLYKLQKKIVRNWLYEGKRVDGRGIDEIRPLAAEVGLLPRVHQSQCRTADRALRGRAVRGEHFRNQPHCIREFFNRRQHRNECLFCQSTVTDFSPSRTSARLGFGSALLERLDLAGLDLRFDTGSDGCRRSAESTGCRYFLRSDYQAGQR